MMNEVKKNLTVEPHPADYPKTAIDDAIQRGQSGRGDTAVIAREALRRYEEMPHLRYSPTFNLLHFAVVSSVFLDLGNSNAGNFIHIDPGIITRGINDDWRISVTDSYDRITHSFDEQYVYDPWEDHSPDRYLRWRIIDVDIEDATGRLFQTRILYNEGFQERDQDGGNWGLTSSFGKVYDRSANFRLLARIVGPVSSYDVPYWVAEPSVAFAEHAHLAPLPTMFQDPITKGGPGECDGQFTALLKLAPASVQCGAPHGSASSGAGLLRTMLRVLANPNSTANADSIIVKVLCAEGPPQEMILAYAAQRYPVAMDRSDRSGEGCCPSLTLAWTDIFPLLLVRAMRLHNSGKKEEAVNILQGLVCQ